MDNQIEKSGNTVVATLVEHLDAVSAAILDGELRVAVDDEEVTNLVLDLKNTKYTSSAGLRVFVAMQQLMTKRGGRLVLRNVCEEVMGIFRITCFDELFEIE